MQWLTSSRCSCWVEYGTWLDPSLLPLLDIILSPIVRSFLTPRTLTKCKCDKPTTGNPHLLDFSDLKELKAFPGVTLQWQVLCPLNSKTSACAWNTFRALNSTELLNAVFTKLQGKSPSLPHCQVPPQNGQLASGWAATLWVAPQISLSWSSNREGQVTFNQFTCQKTVWFYKCLCSGFHLGLGTCKSTWDLDLHITAGCRTLGWGTAVRGEWSRMPAFSSLMLPLTFEPPWGDWGENSDDK